MNNYEINFYLNEIKQQLRYTIESGQLDVSSYNSIMLNLEFLKKAIDDAQESKNVIVNVKNKEDVMPRLQQDYETVVAYMCYYNINYIIKRENMWYYFESEVCNTEAGSFSKLMQRIIEKLEDKIYEVDLTKTLT